MSDLVRFGVAMDRALLAAFDDRITARGYENRSEALRDLVRADLTKAAWQSGAAVAGTVTFVFAKKSRAEVSRVLDAAPPGLTVSNLEVPLDDVRSLGVLVLRGNAGELSGLAGRLAGARGVFAAELAIGCVDDRPAASEGA
jgi:CopG family transcriptional regulator, nickel-responsive regulator